MSIPSVKSFAALALLAGLGFTQPSFAAMSAPPPVASVSYRHADVDGIRIFYREAGDPAAPTVLLLHGFPTSSHMYRNLIPRLADRYHVIAPDLPGFGFSDAPDRSRYSYTFANLAKTMDAFTQVLGFKRYAIQVFDYGAPVGFRLAISHPERITAIVSQNGNAYVEGLGSDWDPIRTYWKDPTLANRAPLRAFLTPEAIRTYQYLGGASDPEKIAPEAYTLDAALLARPGNEDIQLDLFLDYASNVALYPAFQRYLRENKPPLLAVWGRNDRLFIPPGAEAFKRDNPNAEVHFYDAGHFALESRLDEIAPEIHGFLDRHVER
jgi:pimeloyl-ACP methyl ester carboxylesterase